jgi:subtilisin family serine protease
MRTAAVALLVAAALMACQRHDGGPARPLVAVVDGGIARVGPLEAHIVDRIDIVPATEEPLDPHGTAMASIVASRCPAARLVDVRVIGADGRGTAHDLIAGIDAASDRGADVVLLSVALPTDPTVDGAIAAAAEAGASVIVAAGNDGVDLDLQQRWRTLAAIEGVTVVGAEDDHGHRLARSNRGRAVVETWADGHAVPALDPSGGEVTVEGTSPAAALVASAC